MSTLHYYKYLKALINKNTHNFPSFGTLELWKFSNLTFGGYLVCTTPVLSTRSSLFLFRMCCLKHVRTVWHTNDFWHHQLSSFFFLFSFWKSIITLLSKLYFLLHLLLLRIIYEGKILKNGRTGLISLLQAHPKKVFH